MGCTYIYELKYGRKGKEKIEVWKKKTTKKIVVVRAEALGLTVSISFTLSLFVSLLSPNPDPEFSFCIF